MKVEMDAPNEKALWFLSTVEEKSTVIQRQTSRTESSYPLVECSRPEGPKQGRACWTIHEDRCQWP